MTTRRKPRISRREVEAVFASEPESELVIQPDAAAGLRRHRTRTGFRYVSSSGRPVRETRILRRIKSLAIPPAWTDVWISRRPEGHLQATGRDARGRKQYRYHSRWRDLRDAEKYDHVADFAEALPKLRDRVAADLKGRMQTKDRVIAAIVRLLALTLIRVGNEEYARDNESFGLTTLRRRHVQVKGARIRFEFKGKSGKRHRIEASDGRVAAVVRQCQACHGRELFEYHDADGRRRRVKSAEVNVYMKSAMAGDFTAKDFRTWAGTVLAAIALSELEAPETERAAKRQIAGAIEKVAGDLGNTPAVCRKSYVHPAVIEAYTAGTLHIPPPAEERALAAAEGLSDTERAVLRLLRKAQKTE